MLILNTEYGKTYLEVTETKRRIYNQENIKKVFDKLPSKYRLCFLYGEKMTLLFPDKVNFRMGQTEFSTNKIVLKNVKKNIKNDLYRYLLSKINDYTILLKIGNVNAVRMIALTLASCTILGAYNGIVKLTSSNDKENIDTIQTIEDKNGSIYDDLVYKVSDDIQNDLKEENEKNFSGSIPVGTKLDDYTISLLSNFKKSSNFDIVNYCSQAYQFDCDLFLALLVNETGLDHKNTIPDGSRFNGSGIGIAQVEETNIGKTFSCYNHLTKETDYITVTKENVVDYETNVKIGSIIFKNCLDRYYGNIYLSLQAYNYGDKMMNNLLEAYALECNLSVKQVCLNYDDLGWIKYIEDAHINPQKYNQDWKYSTYGTANYIERVLGYYNGINITYNDNTTVSDDVTIYNR